MRTRREPPYDSTHFAILFIRGQWSSHPIKSGDEIVAAAAARTMSPTQREHVSTLPFRFIDFGKTIGNHSYYRLYGTGPYDTQKMVNAFIEVLANKADKQVPSVLKEKQERKEKISEIKKKLPEKQKQLDQAQAKYNEIKNAHYFASLNDGEVYKKAKETMFQMGKTLDTLEIELAGIIEKLKSIERYRRNKHADDDKKFSLETLDKLDQMYVEQMIELNSTNVRQQAALKIRKREQEFLNIFDQQINLASEVNTLKGQLADHEHILQQVEEKLANPTPEMRPPKVYQNKVNIYSVKSLGR
jgi:chromosome segregation ATPase